MYTFLENLDKHPWIKKLLGPIYLLLEYLCYKKFWNKIVVPELIETDEIFEFLNKNEFSYNNGKLIKKELINDVEFLHGRSLDECNELVKREFMIGLTKLIEKHCNTNIEQLLTLYTRTDTITHKDEIGNLSLHNIFEVHIQFCRYYYLKIAKRYTIVWCIFLILIISAIYFSVYK